MPEDAGRHTPAENAADPSELRAQGARAPLGPRLVKVALLALAGGLYWKLSGAPLFPVDW